MSKKTQKTLKIFLVGGGSGGHVTPLRALAQTLDSKLSNDKSTTLQTIFVSEKKARFDEIMDVPYVHGMYKLSAGKFRRYHGDSVIDHLKDVKTIALNTRDFFLFLLGCLQAIGLLIRKRPDVIFLKGGFVCVPVGWAARLLNIPYVTHDSDVVPGLANRLTGKSAQKNLVALEGDYPYEKAKTVVSGIPIDQAYFDSSEEKKKEARDKLEIPANALVVLVTGGGLGALHMNSSVIRAFDIIAQSKDKDGASHDMFIVHLTGKALYNTALDEYEKTTLRPDKVRVVDFTTDMISYVRAADIIISRAGATAIAEFAAAKKPCIFIPGAHLTGGQQLHNANVLEKKKAAFVLVEQDIDGIVEAITRLATDDILRNSLGDAFSQFAVRDSSAHIVGILFSIAGYQPKSSVSSDISNLSEATK